jgi:VanZ family protein
MPSGRPHRWMSPLDRIRLIGSLSPSITMRRHIWCGFLVLYAGAIFALSQMPVTAGELPFAHFDKYFHAAEFALFLALAWKATNRRPLLSFALTAVYAGTDELHQLFVMTRTASALDLAVDLLGAAIALLVLEFGQRLWRLGTRRILGRTHSKVEW